MRASCLVLLLLLAGFRAEAADYVWPLSNSTTPDAVNTSFGPRINYSMWDLHDSTGIRQSTNHRPSALASR